MDRYNLYCTEKQTLQALSLGAPIKMYKNAFMRKETPHFKIGNDKAWIVYIIPTVEQMCGWLKTKGVSLTGTTVYLSRDYDSLNRRILVVIDSALEYLTNKK